MAIFDKNLLPPREGCYVGEAPKVTERRPAAYEVTDHAERLVGRARLFAERAEEKLAPVLSATAPAEPTNGGIQREFPPLFNQLRNSLDSLDAVFDHLESLLSRTEL